MNLKCLICSDLFTPSADIYVTPCGHLFHHTCLIQWIERSRTCPQCRNKTTDKTIHRVYISVEENGEITDFSTLQNRCDNLQFQINLKDKDIKISNDKYRAAKAQNVGLREEIKDQENRVRVLESAMHALKEQIAFFKSKAKDGDKLVDQIENLKQRLKDMEHVEMVITGSREQVNDMLRHNRDPQSLTVLVSTLKKELIDSDRKKKQIQSMLKEAQNESQNYRRELARLTNHNDKLQHDVQAHKHCESERKYLKRKLCALQTMVEVESPSAADSSIRRIIEESPAPLAKIISALRNDALLGTNESPSVPEKVLAIKDSKSPHLQVQSSSIGLSRLMNYNNKYEPRASSSKPNNKMSIFKQPSLKVEDVKRPSSLISYDGMGGHSKDDQFPTPEAIRSSLKRPKSTSTMTSAKFRKLAPAPQRKLNDFFNESQ